MRAFLLTMAVIGSFAVPATEASAANSATAISRNEIRSMPITERPNRPGHFYGNTVRRRVDRGH